MKVIYISGYGRSGSTLLELILNKEPNIIGLGEISNLNEAILNNEVCSCGKHYSECEFWQPIIEKIKESKHKFKRSHFLNRYFNFFFNKDFNDIKALLNVLSQLFPNQIFVDSSKSTRRGFMRPLHYLKVSDVRVVHIIRECVDCIASNKKTSNHAKRVMGVEKPVRFAFLKTTFNWLLANRGYFLYKNRIGSSKITVITFNDLVNDYENSIVKINQLLSSYDVEVSKNQNFVNSAHLIRGNRLSKEETITIKKVKSNRQLLSPNQQKLAKFLTNKLYKKIVESGD